MIPEQRNPSPLDMPKKRRERRPFIINVSVPKPPPVRVLKTVETTYPVPLTATILDILEGKQRERAKK